MILIVIGDPILQLRTRQKNEGVKIAVGGDLCQIQHRGDTAPLRKHEQMPFGFLVFTFEFKIGDTVHLPGIRMTGPLFPLQFFTVFVIGGEIFIKGELDSRGALRCRCFSFPAGSSLPLRLLRRLRDFVLFCTHICNGHQQISGGKYRTENRTSPLQC